MPVIVARSTAGVAAVFQADDAFFLTFDIRGIATALHGVQHVLGIVDLGFAAVELDLCMVANHQYVAVTQADVAVELA